VKIETGYSTSIHSAGVCGCPSVLFSLDCSHSQSCIKRRLSNTATFRKGPQIREECLTFVLCETISALQVSTSSVLACVRVCVCDMAIRMTSHQVKFGLNMAIRMTGSTTQFNVYRSKDAPTDVSTTPGGSLVDHFSCHSRAFSSSSDNRIP
jgi:hypothetical protein